MRKIFGTISVLSLLTISSNVSAIDKCLTRDETKNGKLFITDFQAPNKDAIFIMWADTDAVCTNTLCDVRAGDSLHVTRDEFLWKRAAARDVKFTVANLGDGIIIPRYLKLTIPGENNYVYYLMQADKKVVCRSKNANTTCNSYYFEAYKLDQMGTHKTPENGKFSSPAECGGTAQPGSGGGNEPPP